MNRIGPSERATEVQSLAPVDSGLEGQPPVAPDNRPVPRLTVGRLIADIPLILRSPADAFATWHGRYGDVVRVPLTRPPTFHVHAPEDIRHVLISHRANYGKAVGERFAARVFGRGLLRSRGRLYRKQRAIIGPSFHRKRVGAMADAMARETAAILAGWSETDVDIAQAMAEITLRNVARTLFTADLSHEAAQLIDDLTLMQRFIDPITVLILPRWIPTRGRRAYERAAGRIEALAYRLVEQRRLDPSPADDLLSALVQARDGDGAPMPDRQIRDELLTMLFAGYETTATGLAWLWYEVVARPELAARLRAEADEVLGDKALPDASDVRRLELAEATFRESLRLHSPIWAIGRRAEADDVLPSGHRVPAGCIITVSPFVVHRRPDLFPDPLDFRPERFLRGSRPPLPAGSYIPFGAGPRSCIGEGFAMQEAAIIIAMVVRSWDLEQLPGPAATPETLLARRPRNGVRVRLRRRV